MFLLGSPLAEQRLRIDGRCVVLYTTIYTVGAQLPRLAVVAQHGLKHGCNVVSDLLIKDRHRSFHAPLRVACHKIGRGNIDFLSREGTKQIDSGMFQKSPHDADHTNIVGFSGNAGLQATNPPYDHIDLHAGF